MLIVFTKKMLIVASVVIASAKNNPCPSIGDWFNKLWYIHTVAYYAAVKRIHYIAQPVWFSG